MYGLRVQNAAAADRLAVVEPGFSLKATRDYEPVGLGKAVLIQWCWHTRVRFPVRMQPEMGERSG